MIELRWQPLDTWEPGAVEVCIGTDNRDVRGDEYGMPLVKWARLEWRDVQALDENGAVFIATDWQPVKLAEN